MEKNENARELAEIIEHAMIEFNAAMKRREELSIRIGRRTTQIVRMSMVGMTLLTASIVFLIHYLTKDTHQIAERLDEIATYIQQVNQNIVGLADNMHQVKWAVNDVKLSVDQLNTHVEVMPMMNLSVGKISNNMLKINSNINYINTNIGSLNDNVNMISIDMARMSHQFDGLNRHLGMMGYNVDKMAAPMTFFPFSR